MKKMKRVFTLLSLLVLFSTTISVPFASAKEGEFLYSTNAIQMEVDSQSEYDLKALEIIKELETSDEGVIVEEYQVEEYKTDEEAGNAASKLGYSKISEKCGKAAIFRNKKTNGPEYISRDMNSHIGGAWKGASSPGILCSKDTRSGKYDKNLNRIGD